MWAAVPAGIRGRERAAISLCLLSNKFITLPHVKNARDIYATLLAEEERKQKKNLLSLSICLVYSSCIWRSSVIGGGWSFISNTQTCEVER